MPPLLVSSASRPQANEEPRSSPTARPSVAGKKAKMSPAKKLRIDRVTDGVASCIRVVKVGELYTIDEPEADPGDQMPTGRT